VPQYSGSKNKPSSWLVAWLNFRHETRRHCLWSSETLACFARLHKAMFQDILLFILRTLHYQDGQWSTAYNQRHCMYSMRAWTMKSQVSSKAQYDTLSPILTETIHRSYVFMGFFSWNILLITRFPHAFFLSYPPDILLYIYIYFLQIYNLLYKWSNK
jgi:hypothetical protein